MKLTSEELKSLYQEGTSRTATTRTGCPASEVLAQAASGAPSETERERLVDHLGKCSDCAQEFRLARELKIWAEETGQAFAVSANQASTLETSPKSIPLRVLGDAGAPPPALWQRFSAFLSPARLLFAFAAQILILVTIGGWLLMTRQENPQETALLQERLAERDRALDEAQKSLAETRRLLEEAKSVAAANQHEDEIAKLRRTVSELSNPQLDVPIIDLDPGGAVRGGPKEAITIVEVPKTANLITLILNFTDQQQYASYRVELFNQQRQQVWRGQSVRKSQASSLNVTLARNLVPDGPYVIKLFGLRDGKKEPVAEYSVTINTNKS